MRTLTMTGGTTDFQHQSDGWQTIVVQQQTSIGAAIVGVDQNVNASGNGIRLAAGQAITITLAPNQKLYFFGDQGERVTLIVQQSMVQVLLDWLTPLAGVAQRLASKFLGR